MNIKNCATCIKCSDNNKCISSIHWKINNMLGGGKPQWTVLQHNGPMFPPPYVVHKIHVIVNNNNIILPEVAEEYATMYAKFIDTPYITNNTFKKNFGKISNQHYLLICKI